MDREMANAHAPDTGDTKITQAKQCNVVLLPDGEFRLSGDNELCEIIAILIAEKEQDQCQTQK